MGVILRVNTFMFKIMNMRETLKGIRYKSILKNNTKFHDIHMGERCFIIGNGPSIKNVDFSLLADEVTFTVNNISRNESYIKLYNNYHVWADMNFFTADDSIIYDSEYIRTFLNLNTENSRPTCFAPIAASSYFKKSGLEKELDMNYYNGTKEFYDGYDKSVDFSKTSTRFPTVIMQCIMLAIYMGFKEIYLLGCDCTGIIGIVEAAMKQSITSYGFNLTEADQKRLSELNKSRKLSGMFKGWMETFLFYERISDYCERRDIVLINCTEGTILDSVAREKLDVVLTRGVS